MSGAHGRLCWLLQEGWMSVPTKYYYYVRSPYHVYQVWSIIAPTIDAQRHGGLFAVREPNGAYNTVDTNVGAYNTICVRAVVGHCSHRRTGYGPGIMV